jgi:hypothetical protein
VRQPSKIVLADGRTLADVLAAHRLWLEGNAAGVRANLAEADLAGVNLAGVNLARANLAEADLAWANLADANLRGADLAGANLDYSSWPLWCGSFGAKCSRDLWLQLLTHAAALNVRDATVADRKLRATIIKAVKGWRHTPETWAKWPKPKPKRKAGGAS